MALVKMLGAGTIGVGIAALALELVVLTLALRAHAGTRRFGRALVAGHWSTTPPTSPPKALAICGAVPPLLVLGWMVHAVQSSRAMIFEGVTAVDLGRKASLASTGLVHELGSIFSGMLGLGLLAVLGAVTAGVAASARAQWVGLSWASELAGRDREAALAWVARPGPGAPMLIGVTLAFVVLGLGPVIAGALSGTWLKLRALDEVTEADPGGKAAIYERAQLAAGTILERGYLTTMVGVACAALGSATLASLASPSRARRRVLGRPVPEPQSSGSGAVTVASLLLAASALVALARPMKRENEMPWPPGLVNDGLGVETPALDGPDSLELGPLVAVTATGLAFDRVPEDAAGVEARLRAYRANFSLHHPGEPPPREILLACAPNAGSERAFAAIEAGRRSGYDGVRFVFEIARPVFRPVIGTVTLKNVTAARVSVGADTPTGAESLRPDGSSTCAQLAARVVALRRVGRPVVLIPPAASPQRHQPLQE
jgi:hypothetical protein